MGKKTTYPIAVTMGDPAGIGAEITSQAWQKRKEESLTPFVFIGDPKRLGSEIPVKIIEDSNDAKEVFDKALPVLPIELPIEPEAGKPDSRNASAVLESIDRAVQLVIDKKVSALVTNPIQKGTLQEAGFAHPGHTEYIADLTGSHHKSVMMLVSRDLRVVPLTIHVALQKVSKLITQDLILAKTQTTVKALQDDFGILHPRIVVAGLNPHAGEYGQFGKEEIDIIAPAIETLRECSNGEYSIEGPFSADTLFHDHMRQNYDAAICMYHDQALIPLKTLDFFGGVNITLGLPIIRTSPDHGTALDIAGRGVARPDSLVMALKMATKMAENRALCHRQSSKIAC